MRRVSLKVLLPILCSIALLFSVVGSVLVSGISLSPRQEKTEIEKILDRDGYIEGIWYPWFQHSFLGHCLSPNKMAAGILGNNFLKVGIDQYGEINIYREIYNLKALGFNLLGYEGSPYGEGVVYGPNGEVLGIEEEYVKNVRRFLNICKENGTAIRIGVNHGSLSDRIMCRYGNTPEGMVESCMEFLRICVEEQFRNVVLSIKASNTVVMVQTVRLLVQEMQKENMAFPVHLGVTEAGEGEDGRIKSAVGIGALLAEGIGDTIRVSLSEAPEKEIPVARKLVAYAAESAEKRAVAKAGIKDETIYLDYNESCLEDLQLKAAMDAGALLIDGYAKDLIIKNSNNHISAEQLVNTANAILQAARIRFTKPEYISCPGCGRTLYNLEETIAKIKQATSHLVGVKIAIMGCIVNGPGEMADADFGYVGAGRGKISLYKGKECIEKNIPETDAVEKLLQLIESNQ